MTAPPPRVYAGPALLFGASLAGLLLALAFEGLVDAIALVLLAAPLAFVVHALVVRRPRSGDASPHP